MPSWLPDTLTLVSNFLLNILHVPKEMVQAVGTIFALLSYRALYQSMKANTQRVAAVSTRMLARRGRSLRVGTAIIIFSALGVVLSAVAVVKLSQALVELVYQDEATQVLDLSELPSLLFDWSRDTWPAPLAGSLLLIIAIFVMGLILGIRSAAIIGGVAGVAVIAGFAMGSALLGSLGALLLLASATHAHLAAEDATPVIVALFFLAALGLGLSVSVARWTFRVRVIYSADVA